MSNIIYKYCKPNRAKSILRANQLHFSSHVDLNDPQDCLVEVDFMGNYFQLPATGFTILSLSTVRDSQAMWSKYGKEHVGICIGFKTPIYQNRPAFHFQDNRIGSINGGLKGYLPLFEVKYERSCLPRYKSPGGDPNVAFNYLTHKASQWSYENEYRVIMDESQINLFGKFDVEFDPSILEEVILGQDITLEDQEEIVALIKSKYPNAKLFKVTDSSSELVKITKLET